MFNPLPWDKILDVTKLKAFADDKSNVVITANSHFEREKKKEKEKMMVVSIFIFSLIVSFKAFLFRVVKSRNCLVKG